MVVSWGEWHFVRRLVREELCARPQRPRYIHAMITGIKASRHRGHIREALLEDPELLDDEVWEVFETEPMPGMLELFSIGPWVPPESRWEVALAWFAS